MLLKANTGYLFFGHNAQYPILNGHFKLIFHQLEDVHFSDIRNNTDYQAAILIVRNFECKHLVSTLYISTPPLVATTVVRFQAFLLSFAALFNCCSLCFYDVVISVMRLTVRKLWKSCLFVLVCVLVSLPFW